jgi:tRNA (guanine-N1)-methyltransferase
VLTGGELAGMVMLDAITRLVPGVLGDDASRERDCFSRGLLGYPQYTRPKNFRGMRVPDLLLSGNHGKVAAWRAEQARRRTAARRPELLYRRVGEATLEPREGDQTTQRSRPGETRRPERDATEGTYRTQPNQGARHVPPGHS